MGLFRRRGSERRMQIGAVHGPVGGAMARREPAPERQLRQAAGRTAVKDDKIGRFTDLGTQPFG